MDELRRHPGLLAQLERARTLGFLGPGPVEPHIDHAATFVQAVASTTGTIVDLGSGGGVPGLVLAVARPDLHLVLVDARSVRCRFLEAAVATLDVDAEVVEGRAEVVGQDPTRRGSAQAVLARSFGPPAATAECAAPLLAIGGRLVVSEPPPPPRPERWPAGPLRALGLEVRDRVGDSPAVQVLELTSPCPPEFPRRDGLPAHRPLF